MLKYMNGYWDVRTYRNGTTKAFVLRVKVDAGPWFTDTHTEVFTDLTAVRAYIEDNRAALIPEAEVIEGLGALCA